MLPRLNCGRQSQKKINSVRQGIISSEGCKGNCMKLRINAADKSAGNTQDKAIADAYGNKFIIPLDFEMLDSVMSYYQEGLGNKLCYEFTFNDYNPVIKSAIVTADAKHKISNISFEYEIVTQPVLATDISEKYQKMALMYERVLRQTD